MVMELQASRGEEEEARRSSGGLEMEGRCDLVCLMLLVTEFDVNSSFDLLLTDGIKARIGWKVAVIFHQGSRGCRQASRRPPLGRIQPSVLPQPLPGRLLLEEPEPASAATSHLVAKLRRYEALNKRCGSGSELFKEAIRHLNSSSANLTAGDPARSTDCSYVV